FFVHTPLRQADFQSLHTRPEGRHVYIRTLTHSHREAAISKPWKNSRSTTPSPAVTLPPLSAFTHPPPPPKPFSPNAPTSSSPTLLVLICESLPAHCCRNRASILPIHTQCMVGASERAEFSSIY